MTIPVNFFPVGVAIRLCRDLIGTYFVSIFIPFSSESCTSSVAHTSRKYIQFINAFWVYFCTLATTDDCVSILWTRWSMCRRAATVCVWVGGFVLFCATHILRTPTHPRTGATCYCVGVHVVIPCQRVCAWLRRGNFDNPLFMNPSSQCFWMKLMTFSSMDCICKTCCVLSRR